MQTMLTVPTQNSGFRRSAGCISREGRQKGLAAQVECGAHARCQLVPVPSIISLALVIRFFVESYGGVYVQQE